ncbi:helix-turn-helix domain-containing protein [Actinoplanes friuliensis]|uniref:Helix-turn-helix domain-containing protein n=1 Tax=Actinoplanes friuliensis DSM 7358 TaxID=1246995 RepID=U5VP18_9ACTN|nr:helix-turn-helix transcriptional regulator [Actinoplanes friuliensis]AGZ38693.1 helix-turn-helix domain-containing protein [Actinoplanes friuliensis DSM 7358]
MAEGDSPTVARRRVRIVLREARERAGLTQLEVAEEMEWSLSKVIRIENGDVAIAPNDLRPLLAYLGVKDRALIAEMLASAKIARTRQTQRQVWYQSPEFREHLTDGTRRLIEYEAEAASIHSYSVFHIPGPLQIPSYSEALMNMWRDEMSEEQRKVGLDARRRRHDAVVERVGSLRFTALLDESVFMRAVGGPRIFADQLQEILRLEQQKLVSIRMFPFSADAALSYNAGFDILFIGTDNDLSNAVMYRETGTSDEIVEDRATTERHHLRYQKLWDAALTEVETLQFVKQRIRDLTR